MWSDFESDVVEGRYPLGKLVRSEGRCGWFETRFDEKPAIISLFESLNDVTMLLERVRAAQKVSNKNVAAILDAGTSTLRDTPVVYAVMEYTEENLEDVLRTRALSAEETKEVADGLVNALRAIHKERLVCGRLEAASVLAAGDTIKLRSDYLQLIPPDAAFEPHAAKDVRDLGNLLHQCLTQQPLKRATDGNDPSLQLLPAPFAQIVRRTLVGQATLEEVAALLRPGAPTPQPSVPSPVQKAAPVIPQVQPEPVGKKGPARAQKLPPHESPARKSALLIVAGFIVLLLLAVFVIRAIMHNSDRQADAAAKNPVVVVSPETTPRRTPAAVPTPVAPAPTPKRKATPPPSIPASSAASPAGAWRVVAYTYNYQDQAEHKARTINEKYPNLQASVFSPKGSGAPYLVTLGTATDRASAFRLRDKAVAEGLPKDTYAQNYTR